MENESTYKAYSVLPNLYISRFPATASLIPIEITHVLNLCPNPNAPDESARTYHHICTLSDIDDITPYISTIISFISSALASAENKVLVHCHLGINRSAAAVVTYLCWKNREWDSRKATEFLRSKKGDVRPSGLFLAQIDRWFGRESEGGEDGLVGFGRRLEERRRGLRGGGEKMDEGMDAREVGSGD